jgi:glycosyltransferase involved in cell wall biosynthesis
VGALEPEKLGALYCASDVVVLPSYRDTFGKVLAEGALAGKPLITTTACGSAGTLVVSGENGFVIEPGDVDRLRNAMIRLLDPSLREVMGRRSRQVVGRVCSAEAETAGFARVINVAIQTSLVGRLCQ